MELEFGSAGTGERPLGIVAVVVDRGRLLLIRRGASVPSPGYWAPVSGAVEPGEDETDAVVREVREEVGLEVRPLREVWRSVSASRTHDLHWWLAVPVGGRLRPNPREVAEVRWSSPGDYETMEPTFPTDRHFFKRIFPSLSQEAVDEALKTPRMNDLELAISVVGEGAVIVRERFRTALQLSGKGGGDFATNADLEAESAMVASLGRERPRDGIFGEESGRTGPGGAGRVWLIDPLCGTLNYAVRMRVASVNAALRIGDELRTAAVADPFNDEVFYADRSGAFVRSGGRDSPLVPNGRSGLVDLNLDPPFPNDPPFRAAVLASDPDFSARFRPRVLSTTLALTWVASGQRAAYVTDGDLRDKIVHFAAGLAICRSAGCILTDLWGEPWGKAATGLVAAADPETHRALLAIVRRHLPERPE